jgi:crotonobetainyl-CoA:carnitine CoA-transferase CaiB-like acyl-CoA transferase
MGGYMQITGSPDDPPLRLGNEHAHYPGSQYLAVGITGALYYRDFVSGKGQHIDVSQVEATIPYHIEQHQAMMWHFMGQNPTRQGLNSQVGVPLGAFPAKDGWISVLTVAAQEWDNLAQWVFEVTGEKAILDESLKGVFGLGRRQRYEEVNGWITAFTTQVNRNELFHDGQQKQGVPLHPVNTVEDLLNDPHLKASDFWIELDHPVVGKLKYPKRGPFDGEDVPALRKAAPLLGQHNKEIYCGELGLTQKQLALLRSAGII